MNNDKDAHEPPKTIYANILLTLVLKSYLMIDAFDASLALIIKLFRILILFHQDIH